ncbi:MAG: single-stranded-DNA-specific exonuclease RecJ [Bacteroidales bacterium]
MTSSVWKVKENGDPNQIKHLSGSLGVGISLANILTQRGITSPQEARQFFNPKLKDLHDPFLMKDMDKAVERINKAINNQEKIMIYGDYDVDGTTSVAMVYSFLKKYIDDIEYYIPDRYSEGYGISGKSIDYAAQKGISLIIALDCGIKAIKKIDKANGLGVDFIICDHHNPDAEIPKAVAVLDPKRPDCDYPFKELSGCGVGFKLLQAISKKRKIHYREVLELLDLLVVSIAADIVPIVDENRVFTYHGLRKLNADPCMGLKTIMANSKMTGEITVNDIVFKIGPRLNASGRIEHGKKSVKILVADDSDRSTALGEEIDSFNEIRKTLDRDITQYALDFVNNDHELVNKKSTVLYNRDWHKGVVGIVASRLTEHFNRPTVILTESNGLATGSARSVGEFDLYEAISSCSHLLESYGGHKHAAGLTLKLENIQPFTKMFEELVQESSQQTSQNVTIDIDSKLQLSDITPAFYRSLKKFAPFGPGNMKPTFITEGLLDGGSSRLVGKEDDLKHLKLDLFDPYSGVRIPAIAFNQAEHFPDIAEGIPFDICYQIFENEYRGRVSLQLFIIDIKVRSDL